MITIPLKVRIKNLLSPSYWKRKKEQEARHRSYAEMLKKYAPEIEAAFGEVNPFMLAMEANERERTIKFSRSGEISGNKIEVDMR